jgi:hypothetical protein
MRCPHDCYDSRATTFDGVVTSGADARDDDDEDFTMRHRNFRKLGSTVRGRRERQGSTIF